jgi:hypothetical protein
VQAQLASARAARDSVRAANVASAARDSTGQGNPAAVTRGPGAGRGRGGAGLAAGGGGGQRSYGGRRNASFGGRYIVFAMRDGKPTPVEIETGLTDLDYIEVVRGLAADDTVLVLPSASLVAQQKEMRERLQQRSGGGLPGVQRSNTGGSATGSGAAAGGSSDRRTPGR